MMDEICQGIFHPMENGPVFSTPAGVPGGNRIGNAFPVGRAGSAFGGKPIPPYMPPELIECQEGSGPPDTLLEEKRESAWLSRFLVFSRFTASV